MAFNTITGQRQYVGLSKIPHVDNESLEKKHKRMIDIALDDVINQANYDQLLYASWLEAQKTKSSLIKTQAIVINAIKDSVGNIIFTEEQRKQIQNFKRKTITEECPACEGDGYFDGLGMCGPEICTQCKGKKVFSYELVLKIETFTEEEFALMKISETQDKKKIEDFLDKNPDIVPFIGSTKDWTKIPNEINAISIDSKKKIKLYSHVSGIYDRYDDEHSKKYNGGQYWHYGTALDGLDITDKYKLRLFIKDKHKIFYRPGIKPVVLDFESTEPFDWSIFPKCSKRLFVTYGGMNNCSHHLSIDVTTNGASLRDDNVCWPTHATRDNIVDINILADHINDGTEEYCYYIDKIGKIDFNDMNIHFRNIPLKTIVYELPEDRSKPMSIGKLRLLFVPLCNKINEIKIKPISNILTTQKYPFKYEGEKKDVEMFLLSNKNSLTDYIINDDLSIDCVGNVNIHNPDCFNGNDLLYKFGKVDGQFRWDNRHDCEIINSKKYVSLKNIPDWCVLLYINHLKSFVGFNTKIESNIIKLFGGYGSEIKSLKGLPDDIKFVLWHHNDLSFKIPEERIYNNVHGVEEWWAITDKIVAKYQNRKQKRI